MINVLHIAGRELRIYVSSPWTYVVLAAAVFLLGFFFGGQVAWFADMCQRPNTGYMGPVQYNLHTDVVDPFIGVSGIILIFLIPVLTMHLIAGERRQRSIELLLTSPVSSWEIVLGKFLGAMGLFGLLLALLWYAPAVLYTWGEPDTPVMLTSVLGLLLVGACYVAVGVAASSLTENMIVSAILGIVLLLVIWVIEIGTVMTQTEWVQNTLEYISLVRHLESFSAGMIDTRDLVYLGSFVLFFLFVGQQRVEALRSR